MTYVKQHDLASFDWVAFLLLDAPTISQCETAKAQAFSWVTCACGNLCATIPREPDVQPRDRILAKLGMQFMDDIREIDPTRRTLVVKHAQRDAMKTLVAIEERSTIILNNRQHESDS